MRSPPWLAGIARLRSAFSLVELVMVVAIVGMIAAIAVPRISRAAHAASGNALRSTIANVRKAIDAYYAEHGKYPGYNPSTGLPDNSQFADQLVRYSSEDGRTSATYGAPYVYGPYLRPPFPLNPTNGLRTVHVKATPSIADPAAGSVGWVAVLLDGSFGISAPDADLEKIGFDTAVQINFVSAAAQ